MYDEFEDRQSYVSYKCNAIYFRFPGEHVIDDKKYDMELNIKCEGKLTGNDFQTMLVIPASFADTQDEFFDIFNKAKLGDKLTVKSFDSFLNSFMMFNQIFYYYGNI
jgi:hypothetical protein